MSNVFIFSTILQKWKETIFGFMECLLVGCFLRLTVLEGK